MPHPSKRNIKYEMLGLALIVFSLLSIASFITPAVGKIGQIISQALAVTAGNGKYLLPFFLAILGFNLLIQNRLKLDTRSAGIFVFFLTFLIYLHTKIPPEKAFQIAVEGAGGGILGAAPAYILLPNFGTTGTNIILATFLLIGLTLITSQSIAELTHSAAARLWSGQKACRKWIINYLFPEPKTEASLKKEDPAPAAPVDNESQDKILLPSNRCEVETCDDQPSQREAVGEKLPPEAASSENMTSAGLPVNHNSSFRLPAPALLKPTPKKRTAGEHNIHKRSTQLEKILANFGINAKVTSVSTGPAITRYEIQPPPGVKVSKIAGLSDDIALGLATTGIRIEAPIPGKAAVGIEVPNPKINAVHLRELVENKDFTSNPSRLTTALGRDIAGKPIIADLGRMPHLLVAGATGSGKSVCINTIISSILFKATPEEVRLLMVDPKMVELANYNGIPHLVSPVVTDPKKAAGALRWAVSEMEQRYELFAAAGVRDITRYNQMAADLTAENTPLPYIVIIIDELADLMMVAPADVEDAICRLAQMARACGIHLVIATQRPSVDVITGLIKANIPSRISFAVSSQTDSRTILDMGGAEKLLGKGDMLYYPVDAPKPIRVQGAFLSDSEVDSIVSFLKEQANPVYNEEVLQTPAATDSQKAGDEDDLLPQAAQIFIESGTASISMLQRRLHIGYARAARLVDIMERKNIVGGYEGSKPRKVLMTWDQYQQVFGEKQSQAN